MNMSAIVCGDCGIEFHVPSHWHEAKVSEHGSFKCPNGHSRKFTGETEAERLRREKQRLEQRIAERDDAVREQRERAAAAERRAAAARGQVTKLRNRVGRDVCPCCNRTFLDLQRHMLSKHPGFHAEAAE